MNFLSIICEFQKQQNIVKKYKILEKKYNTVIMLRYGNNYIIYIQIILDTGTTQSMPF